MEMLHIQKEKEISINSKTDLSKLSSFYYSMVDYI